MITTIILVTTLQLRASLSTRPKHFQSLSHPCEAARAKNQSPTPEVGLEQQNNSIDNNICKGC
jgi:hypothetical protein